MDCEDLKRVSKIIPLKLKSDGMEFASEMIIRATQECLVITEVPINLYPDGRSRPPHLRTWRDGWRHLKFILMLSPRRFMHSFGFILFILGSPFSILLYSRDLYIFDIIFGTRTFIMTSLMSVSGLMILVTADILDKFLLMNYLKRTNPSKFNLFSLSTETIQFLGIGLSLIGLFLFLTVLSSWYELNFGIMESDEKTKRIVLSSSFIIVGIFIFIFSFVSDLLNYLQKNEPKGK